MLKLISNVILLIILFSFPQAFSQDLQVLTLDEDNIISPDNLELTLDNNQIVAAIIKENDILYIDRDFFLKYMGKNPEKLVTYYGILNNKKDRIFIPLLPALKSIGVRYTYSSLYNKEIIRIRTDGEFKIYKVATYGTYTNQQVSDNNSTSSQSQKNKQFTQNGYPVMNYAGPANYGYYYPANYKPGFYFGSYGFISQGTAPINIYNNGCNCNSSGSTIQK